MKWNDVVAHLKKTSPASDPSQVPTSQVAEPAVHNVRTWIPIVAIFLVIIIGAVIIFFVIRNRNHSESQLTPADAQYLDNFFKNNPPAQVTPEDMRYLKNMLQDDAVVTEEVQ